MVNDVFARAALGCRECGEPVKRLEIQWAFVDGGRWRPSWFLVCAEKHRVRVEPF